MGTHGLLIAALVSHALYADGASADERFGGQGQWLPGGSVGATLDVVSQDVSGREWPDTAVDYQVWLRGRMLHFLWPNIAIGVSANLGFASYESPLAPYTERWWGLGPAVGVNLPLGEEFSLLPLIAAGWAVATLDVDELLFCRRTGCTYDVERPGDFLSDRFSRMWVSVEAPLIWHGATHLFFGLGPVLSAQFTAGRDLLIGGATSVIGTWF